MLLLLSEELRAQAGTTHGWGVGEGRASGTLSPLWPEQLPEPQEPVSSSGVSAGQLAGLCCLPSCQPGASAIYSPDVEREVPPGEPGWGGRKGRWCFPGRASSHRDPTGTPQGQTSREGPRQDSGWKAGPQATWKAAGGHASHVARGWQQYCLQAENLQSWSWAQCLLGNLSPGRTAP